MISAPQLKILATQGWDDYALLDSGGGRKLERFGSSACPAEAAGALVAVGTCGCVGTG
jgi:hypothetical protein